MSVQKIRAALGQLQDDPENQAAWQELAEETTAPNAAAEANEHKALLEAARRGHEQRREWDAVANLLELEIALHAGTPVEFAMQFELARVLDDELVDDARATRAYERLQQLKPDDPTSREALERGETRRKKWTELAVRYATEAEQTADVTFKSSLLLSAADVAYRYGDRDPDLVAQVTERLEEAVRIDKRNTRAASLLERVYRGSERWDKTAEVLELVAAEAASKDERAAALVRLGRLHRKLGDAERAASAYRRTLDLWPGQSEAMTFLSEHFAASKQWDHLVSLYEDQLRSGVAKASEEAGIIFQIAMVNWKMRERPDLAEPYFDKLRRLEPMHSGMLAFFREYCAERGDTARLLTILTDAQRALVEGEARTALATEIAKLAEAGANAQKAIEQYKAILRQSPGHGEARSALRRLYAHTESWNALIELLRQDLERAPHDEKAARLAILHQIAGIYRDRIRSDTALVTVLTQIVQLDPTDVSALRELTRVYETLGRFRDLLQHQTALAGLLTDPTERTELYRSIARRWLEQFSNVQNATEAYEALLATAPGDAEAIAKLKELYGRRRAWPQLFSLYQKEAETVEGGQRLDILVETAKLAAERLDRGADAIALYRQIFAEDPARGDVLDSLEKQAERDKDFATVAWALERRLEGADDDTTRLAVLQKLGPVYSDKLGDPAGSIRTWRRVLGIQPNHGKALRVLRDAYLAGGDYDGLEELYAAQSDWEGLAEVLSTAADRATDSTLKVDLSFRTARILRDQIKVPQRAFRSYERILGVRPDDARAAGALVEIYEEEEKWARLPALYEVLLAAAEIKEEKLELYRKLIDVTGLKLGDRNAALVWARTAHDLCPDEARLALLEDASRAARSWDSFVEAVTAKLKKRKGVAAKERRALRAKLARLYATELGRVDEAVAAYKTLVEEDPDDEGSVGALDHLLRTEDRRDDLRWLFELRAGHGAPPARAAVLSEWAGLEQDVFGDVERATELYDRVLQIDPSNENAARTLPRLLLTLDKPEDAVRVVEAHRDRLEGAARASRELDLSDLYLDSLNLPARALECAARSLELAPHEGRAVAILERLEALPEVRARAAELLEAEYAHFGDVGHQALALGVMLETATGAEARLALYWKLAEIEETRLSASGRAFDVMLRATTEFPENLSVWDRASDLAVHSSRLADLADAYRTALTRTDLPPEIELELCDRAAMLHDERLGDAQAATPYLERILERNPGDGKAFGRLKQILTSAERWGELETLYAQAIRGTTEPVRRAELLNEVALVCEEITNEAAKAIVYYESILAVSPSHENATRALEQLYAREGQYDRLAGLLEQRLASATPEKTVDLKVRLGEIHLDRLHEPQRALDHLEEVLRLDVSNAEARQLVERILEIGSLRARAARVLETVYEARDEIRDLVRVLEIQLEAATEPEARLQLLRRIAVLRDERLSDDAGALHSYSELVPLDPGDTASRERLSEIGRRLGAFEQVAAVLTRAAEQADNAALRSTILMQVASIHETDLRDLARAESVYRATLAIEPTNSELALPAARALERLYSATGNSAALADILDVEVGLEDTAEARRELYGRLGEIAENILGNSARAIEAWRKRLEDDPADDLALASLERLYEGTGAFRALCDILRVRQNHAADGGTRREIMLKAARTLDDKLDDKPEAILAFRAVLDEFGPDRPTLKALEKLYEATGRSTDLADTLELDLGLSEEPEARLELLARLGEVRRAHQEDWQGALSAYRQALAIDPSHAPSRAGIEALLDVSAARREAAETLHPLYEADADHDKLLRVLEIEATEAESTDRKLEFLEQAVRVAEHYRSDPGRAFDYAVLGVREAAAEPEAIGWLERVEALAQATGRYAELVALLQEVSKDIVDEEVSLKVALRIGELAKEQLGDQSLARRHYERALELRGDDRRALTALESLYEELQDGPALLDIVRRRVEAAADDDERRALLFRQATLCREVLHDRTAAIAVYEAILDLSLDPEAIAALEVLYAETERWSDRMSLYERQLHQPDADKPELYVRLASTAREHMGDVDRAFDALEAALEADAQHPGAIRELESILGNASAPEYRGRAAEMLEPVYMRRADFARLMDTLSARLDSSQDPDVRRPLLRRLAQLKEEQTEDYRGALETVALLLHEDLGDESTWGELERLAKVAGAERRLAEIYATELDSLAADDGASAQLCRRTGEIYAELGDIDPALRYYRRALAFEPESVSLFQAIDALLQRAGRPSERVDLYRSALDYRYQPSERLLLLHAIAALERGPLADPERAITTYRSALDVDETDAHAQDALTELYRERGHFTDLADLYERRAEQAADPASASAYRLALARLQRAELGNTGGALDQYEEIVGAVPDHQEAIQDLEGLSRDPDYKARVVEILRPLYEQADDWQHLIALNQQRFELATARTEQVAVLRETADLWEQRGQDDIRALSALCAAFRLDPDDPDTRDELERVSSKTESWDVLAATLEEGIPKADPLVRRELLSHLAELHDQKRDDPRSALAAYDRLFALDETDDTALPKMDELATLLSDWTSLVRILSARASLCPNDEDRAQLYRRIGEVKRDMLEDRAGATLAYERALELEPDSSLTVDCLIELYEAADTHSKLVTLYRRRVELAGPDEDELKHRLLWQCAQRYEKDLRNHREAIDCLREASALRPSDAEVLRALERLYRVEEMWPELLDNLRAQAEAATDLSPRVQLRKEIGQLYAARLDDPNASLEAYRAVLEEAPTDVQAIDAVMALGTERDDLSLAAASVLEPVLRSAGQFEKLVVALEMRAGAETDPQDRAQTLRAISTVLDAQLARPGDALEVLIRALAETPEDAALYAEIERLAAASRNFARYADALEERASSIFDAAIAQEVWKRLGAVAEQELHDDRRATAAYVRASEHAGDEPEILVALDRLYGRTNNAAALAEVLERRISVESDAGARGELFFRVADLQRSQFGQSAQALSTLKQALDCAPNHDGARQALEALTEDPTLFEEAAEALEDVYRRRGDNDRLVALYEKRVLFAEPGHDRTRVRLDLAKLLETQVHDSARAQEVIEQALIENPSDFDLVTELERLAGASGTWASAASTFAKAIEGGLSELTSETARDGYVRLAGWYEGQLGNAAEAERALVRALDKDGENIEILRSVERLQRVSGRERDLVDTLRRIGRLELDPANRRQLFREAKTLAETVVLDLTLTEQVLRQLLEDDEADGWALEELTRLREQAGDWPEVMKLVLRRSELSSDGDVLAGLQHAAADIAYRKLGQLDRAIELYETLFDNNPQDLRAAAALREIYVSTKRERDLGRLLERLIDVAEGPSERSTLRLELAKLEAPQEPDSAIETLRSVLDEDPGHADAVLLLSQLYEKAGQDEQLADLLGSQIELAKDRGDAAAELAITVRLGQIFETRLSDTARAIATYEAVLERSPTHTGALEALARLFEGRGELLKAADALARLLASDAGPGTVDLALRLADIHAQLKDDASAERALEQGLERARSDTRIRKRLAQAYERSHSFAKLAELVAGDAEQVADTAAKVKLYRSAAELYIEKQGNPSRAAELLERAAELAPSDRELLLALCDAYSAAGRAKEAAASLEKVVASFAGKRSKELAGIHQRLSRAYLAEGDRGRALAELDQAFKIDPGSVTILKDLGTLSIDSGDLERAQKTFRALLLQRLDANSPISKGEVFFYLGEISHRQGDKNKAIQMLERSLENDANLARAKELLAQLKA